MMQLVLFSILNFSLDQLFIIATRFEWEYFYRFDIPLNVHKVDDSLHVTGLYTIPMINQNNITFIGKLQQLHQHSHSRLSGHLTSLYSWRLSWIHYPFIAFADTSVTVLIHWLQLGACTHCLFFLIYSFFKIFNFQWTSILIPQIKNSEYCWCNDFFYYFLLPLTLFQPLLGNVTFLQGSRRFFFAVTPKETSFSKPGDVPDYLNEVSTLSFIML